MTQDQYDELLDELNAAEYRCEQARRAVLKFDAPDARETWVAAKAEVERLAASVKTAAETL